MKKYLLVILILIPVLSRGQNFKSMETWLKDNAATLGGRVYLIIEKDGKIVYSNGFNNLNLRQKIIGKAIAKRQGKVADLSDFSAGSRQPIASCSKWLSAALVMTFVDEGKLKLTDTVGRYLPSMRKNGKGAITISQCLSHTTAIKAPSLRESLDDMRNVSTMDEAIGQIAVMPMEGSPGKVFHYSNAGLQIAAAVIEKISGKSFETLFMERIAKPLEMTNTDFGRVKVPLPAGGAQSTPTDYIHFLTMIRNKGIYNGKRILSAESIAEMQVNRITEEVRVAYSPGEAGDLGYGYGEWVSKDSRPGNLSKSVSSPGLFGSFPWVDNQHGYSAFLMTYNINNTGRAERYRELKALVDEILN